MPAYRGEGGGSNRQRKALPIKAVRVYSAPSGLAPQPHPLGAFHVGDNMRILNVARNYYGKPVVSFAKWSLVRKSEILVE